MPPASADIPEPALFDMQVNGFAGVDFQAAGLSAQELGDSLAALRARSTTILFTLITDTVEALCAKLRRVESLRRDDPRGATIEGYHLEGPYLSPRPGFHGAHPPELTKAPDCGEFDRLWAASGGNLRLITLAPEWPGSAEFIRHAVDHGVRVAIGHSDADDRTIDDSIAAGTTLCTHLGNGVPIQLHRHDNVVQRLLARDELTAVFIPDGIHVPPGVLRNLVRAKPAGKALFTTDCMAAAGVPPGRYRLGRFEVEVGADGVVREPGKENFAGSSLTMDAAVANVRHFLRWDEREALAACSSLARAAVGLDASES